MVRTREKTPISTMLCHLSVRCIAELARPFLPVWLRTHITPMATLAHSSAAVQYRVSDGLIKGVCDLRNYRRGWVHGTNSVRGRVVYCLRCANELQGGSGFCPKCGQQTGAAPMSARGRTPEPAVRTGFIALLLVVILAGGAGLWVANQPAQAGNKSQPRTYTTTMEPAFTIRQLNEKNWKFSVPAGATNVRLQGHFVASGGSGNDVQVYLMNDDEFVNWRNRHPIKPIYNSQKVTQGTINVPLPSEIGTYYLVFDNRFSLISPKAVQDNLTLQYTK
jgi:hypothetical protein